MSIKRLVIPLCAALALGVAACGSDDEGGGDSTSTIKQEKGSPAQSKPVTIAFSAPGADHGWMAAITENARKQADELEGVTLKLAEGVTDTAAQADQIETLIAGKPDALVVLPNEGEALTPVALKAMEAGIPVINVDREFSEDGAYRTLITGDNYGIGYQAGNYFADELKCKGNVVEIAGIAGISVTEQRSQGFKDALQRRCEGGIKIVASQPADFLPDKGLTVMENILQAQDRSTPSTRMTTTWPRASWPRSRTPAARARCSSPAPAARRQRWTGSRPAVSTARPSSTTPRCRPPRSTSRVWSPRAPACRISPSRRCPPRSRWPPPR